MRIVYLTLLFFIVLGIGANCRTPPIAGADHADNERQTQGPMADE
jgi:hypothetical protein